MPSSEDCYALQAGCMGFFIKRTRGVHLDLWQFTGPGDRIKELAAVRILQCHRQVRLGQEHLPWAVHPVRSGRKPGTGIQRARVAPGEILLQAQVSTDSDHRQPSVEVLYVVRRNGSISNACPWYDGKQVLGCETPACSHPVLGCGGTPRETERCWGAPASYG